MQEKIDLKQLLQEIEEENSLSQEKKTKVSQDDIQKMLQEKLKRKAEEN